MHTLHDDHCNKYSISLLDKRYKKLETQQQSSLHQDERRDVPDSTNIFSLPQYIRVKVSNYQLLQKTFAIPEDECLRQEIKADNIRQQIKKMSSFLPLWLLWMLQHNKPSTV